MCLPFSSHDSAGLKHPYRLCAWTLLSPSCSELYLLWHQWSRVHDHVSERLSPIWLLLCLVGNSQIPTMHTRGGPLILAKMALSSSLPLPSLQEKNENILLENNFFKTFILPGSPTVSSVRDLVQKSNIGVPSP